MAHYGAALIQDKQFTKGLALLRQAEHSYRSRNLYLSKALGLLQLERYDEAFEVVTMVAETFPDQLTPHLLLGEIQYHRGEIEDSKASLTRCILKQTKAYSPQIDNLARDAEQLWRRLYPRSPVPVR